MEKTEKIVISAATLITSLLCYSYARTAGKEPAPFTMVGAFLGSLIGEALADQISDTKTYKSINNGTERNPGTG